nr:MAG TPA: putative tail fiber protein [Caudoviricetes sp.]
MNQNTITKTKCVFYYKIIRYKMAFEYLYKEYLNVILLSTLGTKSILAESQSLGQNGYLKCSNGLLIQWGKHSGSTSPSVTIYLTESFLDADYIIQGSIIKDASDNNVYSALPIANPTKSSFKLDRNFSSTNTGVSSAKFNWIAIGRWK